MRRVLLLAVSGALCAPGFATDPVTLSLREQVKIEEKVLEQEKAELSRHHSEMQNAWVRVDRESSDLLRAQAQNEGLDSLRLRDHDLREAEAALLNHLLEAQRLRRTILSRLLKIDETLAEVRRLEGEAGRERDQITGTWEWSLDPGGQEGKLYLQQNGTLVQGTYDLSGGYSGSLRGTLVAGNVRLERIDSEIGFAAILYGRLIPDGETSRLQGTWEATQLSAGLPASGTWVAKRLEPEEE